MSLWANSTLAFFQLTAMPERLASAVGITCPVITGVP
jgi:hypothetical protein